MADEEDEDDPHEHHGEVVLLLPPGLLGGGGRVTGHGHLTTVAVLHVLVDLQKARVGAGAIENLV